MREFFKSIGLITFACGLLLAIIGTGYTNMSLDIGIGNVAALEHFGVGIEGDNKFGGNEDVGTSEESLWDADDLPTSGAGPARCFVNIGGTAAALFISSDDENDAAGTITVQALDSTGAAITVLATLGSASAGGTVFAQIGGADLLRINRMQATSVIVGNIYAHLDSTDGNADGIPDTPATDIVSVITAGENQTLQACRTVPLGFTELLTQFCTSNISTAGNRSMVFRLRRSEISGVAVTTEKVSAADGVHQCTPHTFPPIVFAELTDIELTTVASGANAKASGTFDTMSFLNSQF